MGIEDDDYEPAKNTKSPGKKDNLNNSKKENTVSIKTFYFKCITTITDPMMSNIFHSLLSYHWKLFNNILELIFPITDFLTILP